MFIEVATQKILGYDEIKKAHEHICFSAVVDHDFLSTLGYEVLTIDPYPTNVPLASNVTRDAPVLENGSWVQHYTITPIENTLTDFIDEQSNVITIAQQIADILAQEKTRLLTELAVYRYNKEVAGITVNGVNIKTDRESQANINGAYITSQLNPSGVINWKGENGWVALNAIDVQNMASAVNTHVQTCFNKEQSIGTQINATATLTALRTINFDVLWTA